MQKPTRVLIVDDRPRSRDGLRTLLAIWSAVNVVAEAPDGREAVRLVEERQPDLVLMDIRMPVMNGLEATRLIKKRRPGVKVVALTMYPVYRDEALAAGADAFLIKGYPIEELMQAIKFILGVEYD